MKARLLYANLSEYVPQFTIVVGGNTMPTVPSTNDAFWRRCVRIVFDQTVVPKDRDRDLPFAVGQPGQQGIRGIRISIRTTSGRWSATAAAARASS